MTPALSPADQHARLVETAANARYGYKQLRRELQAMKRKRRHDD